MNGDKAKLLTEDRNSLEVEKNGQAFLVRTNDRKETAENLKKEKDAPKPLHD